MAAGANRKSRRGPKVDVPVERSSGNVFEDLGLPDSSERLVKSEISSRISAIIERRGLTQSQAASLLDVSQADVSDLVRGKLKGFSTERLFRFLNALGQDIEIVILERRPSAARLGSLRVLDRPLRANVATSRSRRSRRLWPKGHGIGRPSGRTSGYVILPALMLLALAVWPTGSRRVRKDGIG
jgi:predicted XRE-type DNA-binding protein